MNNKIYEVTAISGTLSTRTYIYIGTLEELSEELKIYLDGVKPRTASSLEKHLNASQRGHEGEYCYKTFFIKEVSAENVVDVNFRK